MNNNFIRAKFVDLNYLKSRFVKLPDSFKFKTYGARYPTKKIMRQFEYIASLYGIQRVKLVRSNMDWAEFFDVIIHIYYTGTGKRWTIPLLCKVFCHEVCHRIQRIVLNEVYEVADSLSYRWIRLQSHTVYLSEIVLYERIAERLAYFLYQEYFSQVLGVYDHRRYSFFRSRRDILFVDKHWKEHVINNTPMEYINDVF